MSGCRQILSGELHYPRVPREYWPQRLAMAYAMGLDTVSTYAFWNAHEPAPGDYDFTDRLDVAAFVREAQNAGLDVILRPGPYVCAEWDFGGLPAWLLAGGEIPVRTLDERYMAPVRRWLARLGQELEPLLGTNGGPIVAVQLENEYGAFGSDRAYLQALRDALDAAGFAGLPYYTIDQPRDLALGCLDGVPIAATFAPGDAARDLSALETTRPGAPKLCGEYWAGWFDHWGEAHEPRDDALQVRDVEWMLRNGVSFNIYMWHGGTNFGFSNGANATDEGTYQPDVTSYDYQAALDEAGRPRKKYFAFRSAIAGATGRERPVPAPPKTAAIGRFALSESAPYDPLLGEGIPLERPVAMETFGGDYGFALYRSTLPGAIAATLEIEGLRDYATVLVDGAVAGYLDRRLGETSIRLQPHRPGARLELLVENCGRINYGRYSPHERKGITGSVRFNGSELRDWKAFTLGMRSLAPLQFDPGARGGPAFFRGEFELAEAADTFFDMGALGKGVLFVNGHNAGRYWSIGPQHSLYVPGVWLRRGRNVAVVFDVKPAVQLFIEGTAEPIMYV